MLSFAFQFTDVANPDTSRRVRLLVGPRTAALRGARHREEGRPSQVQFFHVRIRPGVGAIGELPDVRGAHLPHLPASHGRSPDRGERDGHWLGKVERRRNSALGVAGGNYRSSNVER